jgi:GDP-L-fucose synthase
MIPDPFPTDPVPFYKDKRVVVTGATGLIGSYVVKLLVRSGAQVIAIAHKRPPTEYTVLADGVHQMDLMDPLDARDAVAGSDVVLCCAGITGGVGLTKVDPVSYAGPATSLVINTLHAAHLAKVERFGFLSNTTVYAARETPVEETDELIGDPYPLYYGIGWSKRFLERLCRHYFERTGLKVAIVRPSGAYGRFDNFDEGTSHVIPGMISRAMALKNGDPFEIWGDGGDTRDFVHAQDVAMGFLLAVAKTTRGDPINLASGVGITTRELAQVVLQAVGSRAEIVCNREKLTAMRTRLVSIERAKSQLGYKPSISLEHGIVDTVRWLKEKRQ